MATFKADGMPNNRVMKDSINPAIINKGTKPKTTLAPVNAPFFNDSRRL